MAAKLKDGLFIGDGDTSQDPEFLELNKISNLINCAGTNLPNVWSEHGLAYLTYPWLDDDDQLLFDDNDEIVSDIVNFIEGSLEYGISVLIFSSRGQGRSAVVACMYFMYKYGWGFEKAYDYVYAKKQDIVINRGFIQQMFAFERRLHLQRYGSVLTDGIMKERDMMRVRDWTHAYITMPNDDGVQSDIDIVMEEQLLVNSYLNSKNSIESLNIDVINSQTNNPYDIPKEFKLKFNPLRQEEDVHMFPTEPPALDVVPPIGGIMKGHRVKRTSAQSEAAKSFSSAAVVKGAGMEDLNELSDVSDPPSVDLDDAGEEKMGTDNGPLIIPTAMGMDGVGVNGGSLSPKNISTSSPISSGLGSPSKNALKSKFAVAEIPQFRGSGGFGGGGGVSPNVNTSSNGGGGGEYDYSDDDYEDDEISPSRNRPTRVSPTQPVHESGQGMKKLSQAPPRKTVVESDFTNFTANGDVTNNNKVSNGNVRDSDEFTSSSPSRHDHTSSSSSGSGRLDRVDRLDMQIPSSAMNGNSRTGTSSSALSGDLYSFVGLTGGDGSGGDYKSLFGDNNTSSGSDSMNYYNNSSPKYDYKSEPSGGGLKDEYDFDEKDFDYRYNSGDENTYHQRAEGKEENSSSGGGAVRLGYTRQYERERIRHDEEYNNNYSEVKDFKNNDDEYYSRYNNEYSLEDVASMRVTPSFDPYSDDNGRGRGSSSSGRGNREVRAQLQEMQRSGVRAVYPRDDMNNWVRGSNDRNNSNWNDKAAKRRPQSASNAGSSGGGYGSQSSSRGAKTYRTAGGSGANKPKSSQASVASQYSQASRSSLTSDLTDGSRRSHTTNGTTGTTGSKKKKSTKKKKSANSNSSANSGVSYSSQRPSSPAPFRF